MTLRCADCGVAVEFRGGNAHVRCPRCRRIAQYEQVMAWKRAHPGRYRKPSPQKTWPPCAACGKPMIGAVGRRKRHDECGRTWKSARAKRELMQDDPAHVIEAKFAARKAELDAARRAGTPIVTVDPYAQRPDVDRHQGEWRTI